MYQHLVALTRIARCLLDRIGVSCMTGAQYTELRKAVERSEAIIESREAEFAARIRAEAEYARGLTARR